MVVMAAVDGVRRLARSNGRAPTVSMVQRPLPGLWTVEEYRDISDLARDASNFVVAYVDFANEPGRRATAGLMTKDEARKVAAGIAKSPDLVRCATGRRQMPAERRPRPDAAPRYGLLYCNTGPSHDGSSPTDCCFRKATYPTSIEDKDELAQEFAELATAKPST